MYVDHVQRVERTTAERIENEATSWGLSRQRVHGVVGDFLDSLPTAIERASDETIGLPFELSNAVIEQIKCVRGR